LTSTEIKYKLEHCLLGEKIWQDYAPYRKLEIPNKHTQKAAVSLHIKLLSNDIHIILIERSSYNGKHSQQIAFPGGKMELNDRNLEITARRESHEEIGFGLNEGILLGCLSEIFIPVSSFLVKPFVFLHSEFPKFIKNEREVNTIFTCSLSEIDTTKNKSFKDINISQNQVLKNVPGIHYKQHFIWGATALMLHEFNTAVKTS
jgi:8-oxo-dGTP pyrophosphatase MutT (NUDIX family)